MRVAGSIQWTRKASSFFYQVLIEQIHVKEKAKKKTDILSFFGSEIDKGDNAAWGDERRGENVLIETVRPDTNQDWLNPVFGDTACLLALCARKNPSPF